MAITSCSLDSVANSLKEMDKLSSGGKGNLDVVPSTGKPACYGNDPTNCAKYGRLYDWAAAIRIRMTVSTISATNGWRDKPPSRHPWARIKPLTDSFAPMPQQKITVLTILALKCLQLR